MSTYFTDNDTRSWKLPDEFADEDVRLSEDVLSRYITRFTEENDLVFDPFAGFGTTLVVAEKLRRIGLGYEIVPERAAYANAITSERSEVISGDIRTTDLGELPKIDLCISSPPYMNSGDKEDPLSSYRIPVSSYQEYISQMADIYVRIGKIMKASASLVIQLQNLRNESGVTSLAWDLHAAIDKRLKFVGEEITIWQTDSYGYSHGYCLCYQLA